jgi:hypothetical protein
MIGNCQYTYSVHTINKFYSRSVGKALKSDILTSSRWVREGIDKIILNDWTPVTLGSYKINKSDVQENEFTTGFKLFDLVFLCNVL